MILLDGTILVGCSKNYVVALDEAEVIVIGDPELGEEEEFASSCNKAYEIQRKKGNVREWHPKTRSEQPFS